MPDGEATVIQTQEGAASPNTPNVMDMFRRLDPKSATLIGQDELNGRPVQIYAFAHALASQSDKLWVDMGSGLPVRSEYTASSGSGTVVRVSVDGFVWNPPLDDGLFDLTPPEGYRVGREAETVDNQTDFIALLRLWSSAREGRFPEVMNMKALGQAVQVVLGGAPADAPPTGLSALEALTQREKVAPPPADLNRIEAIAAERLAVAEPSLEQLQQEITAIGEVMGRGIGFFGTLTINRGFVWRGAGVRRGQADRVVCFWQTEEGDGFRVIYGDLRVETTPQAPSDAGS